MKDVQERIEGSFRLIAFRRMKRRIFLMEVVLLMAVAVVLMVFMGASLNPFYVPLDYFILMMLVLVMLLVPESQYLSLLEIAQTKSKSGKYLMARNNVRNATAVVVLCVMFVVLFVLPPSVRAMEEGYTTTHWVNISAGENVTYNFTTRNSIGTVTADLVTFEPTSGDASVYILRYEDWEEDFDPFLSENSNSFVEDGEALLFHPKEYVSGFQRYVVSLNSSSTTEVAVEVTVTYEISGVVTGYMPLLGIVFIVIEGLTVSYFLPIREKYASSSIFSKDYVETKDSGAEKLSEREAALEKALSDDEIAKEAELSEQPCPVEAPSAAAPAKPSQVRKRGVLDVAPTGVKDVACASCGSMNSADSSLCFSCGNALVARPEAKITPEELMVKGKAFLDQGRSQDAVWCFDEVLKGDHRNESALFLKAKALAGDGRRELAIQYLNTVIQINPANQEAHLLRGSIFEALEMREKAADSYEKALAMGPSEVAIAKLKEMREQDREDVINQFMTLPGIGPARANALFDAGITSVDALKSASLEKLCSVKGFTERIAKKMLKDMGREA
jgi:tetratricopeptide (TPR) repeat protein